MSLKQELLSVIIMNNREMVIGKPNHLKMILQNTTVSDLLISRQAGLQQTISLGCCGIGAGDEVIVPTFTFIAPIEAVLQAGAIRCLLK